MDIAKLLNKKFIRNNALLRKGAGYLITPLAFASRVMSSPDDFKNRPPVIVNSLPKSGTHLLLQVTKALPQTRYLGRFIASSPSLTQKERTPETISRKISRILPGETLGCHLYYSDEVSEAIQKLNALHIFIYRDPRDVIFSEAHYLSK